MANMTTQEILQGIRNWALSKIGLATAKTAYCICTTRANVAEKTTNLDGYVLSLGGSIKILMSEANTANNATLNINSTGAKPLYYAGERASATNSWEAGETVDVYYDGTSYYANNVAGGSGSGGGAFDVSVKYPTSGVEGGNTYTLEGALAVLNANLSARKKKGGMSIKFIQSSDNKYVQYRLLSDSFNTTVVNWQGVDKEPVAGSKNLVESGSIILNKNYYRSILASNHGYHCGIINKFIKELWISPTVPLDIDKLCIGNIRKRYNSAQWSITFYNSQTPSVKTPYELFSSTKKLDSLEIMKGTYGSYCLVDWSVIDDGQVMATIDPIYCLDANYVSDIDNFPVIKSFNELEILNTEFPTLKNNINTLNTEADTLNTEVRNIKNVAKLGLPLYSEDLTLTGLTSNDNLKLRIGVGRTAVNYQIWQNDTILCFASFGKTEYEDYYLLTGKVNNLSLSEYQSSGVTGTVSLYTNKILKSDVGKYIPFTYPSADYRLLEQLDNAITNDLLKSRKLFWQLSLHEQNELHKQVSNIVRELYIVKRDGSATDENNLVLGNIRKNYGTSNECSVVIFNAGSNPPEILLHFSTNSVNAVGTQLIYAENANFVGYLLIDWDAITVSNLIASTDAKYLLDWSIVSNIANSPVLYTYLNVVPTAFKDNIIEKLNTTDISWVDDDFNLDSVLRIKNLGLQLGFRSDFGLIPRATGGTGEYPTDFTFSFTSEQLAIIKEVENAGFHCEHHPVHRGWYSSESAGTYQGRQYIEYLLCSGMRLFKENNILNDSCVIYPGGSGSNNEVIEMCRSHMQYGIATSGQDANVGLVDPMTLRRLFIDTISSSKTKTYWKNRILDAYNTNGWIILGTHGHMFDNSGTVDETTPSFANLAEIIEYSNTLSTIKPVSEVYRKRKPMLDLYKV